MSDPIERPEPDAWAEACAEDLAAEQARRRATHEEPPLSAAEELRKLADALAGKMASLQNPLFGMAAQGIAQQVFQQAKAAVEPVIQRNPGFFAHLSAAGDELLAAYRSAVEDQEGRWTRSAADDSGDTARPGAGTAKPGPEDSRQSHDPTDPRDQHPGPDGHIDLD